MLDAGTSASLVAVRCLCGRVRRPRWTPRSDSLPDTACPVDPAGHRPVHPARRGKPEATRTGNGRTVRKAFGQPRSPRPQGGPPPHAKPPPVGPTFAAGQPRLARRWQDCQRDRNHGSDQAATWFRSAVQAAPRRTAVLRGFRVERRASGEASSVMASAWGVDGCGRAREWITTWSGGCCRRRGRTSVDDVGVTSGRTGVVACGWMWRLPGGGSVSSWTKAPGGRGGCLPAPGCSTAGWRWWLPA